MHSKKYMSVLLLTLLASGAHADQLDEIKHAGKITVGVFDSNPPFGYIDAKTHAVAGYDVDFAKALASKLGVKLELKTTNPANRIPLLASGKVDTIVAAFTITEERARQVDFSTPYFVTGQQFLVPKGQFRKQQDLANAKIGAVKGTTEEQELHKAFPQATVLSYDEIALAFAAQRNGNVQVITQDGAILAGLLAASPDKAKYELTPYRVSVEPYGIAVKKGEKRLLDAINQTLVGLEKNGQALHIYNTWFGKGSSTPLPRDFKIALH
ncbi:ABC transporter substrate-binding protein [Paludibacterium yongneupense]|uniref:ABC transporter substrate-binding protein n=1 Tax=Paludibacterium yongneupense TaxID=400061 RepID=UPI00042798D0|nr:ABC transporter substrate-binding protein [Paludibacterium yongneupense]